MQTGVLALTAASLGIVHTLLGPDHYLPFVAIGRARNWRIGRLLGVTAACGVGHVLGSVVLGAVGIAIGAAVTSLETIEAYRGDVAAWFLLSFGLLYMLWGIRKAFRHAHAHRHAHANGTLHDHSHDHHSHEHVHVHHESATKKSITPWVLFIIFLFGPCEPLIPLLMYPAASSSVAGVVAVSAVFCLATVGTMLAVVAALHYGVSAVRMRFLERYGHALAGAVVMLSGVAVVAGL
jgi:sulfite exporter TauE/SafE